MKRTRAIPDFPGRFAMALAVLFASVFPVNLFPRGPELHPGEDGQWSGAQGEVLLIPVSVEGPISSVMGRFLGRKVHFFPTDNQQYSGLLGIDMRDEPGMHELTVEIRKADRIERLSYMVFVVKAPPPAKRLALAREHDSLHPAIMARVTETRQNVQKIFGISTPQRYWRDRFIAPLHGEAVGAFGSSQRVDGQTGPAHSGEDIVAPYGTEVVAINAGIVSATGQYIVAGKGIILDHGEGLYSTYFHLSEILVREGERVQRGQMIGKVGDSGHAIRPHLHWGVRISGARVNPYSLLNIF